MAAAVASAAGVPAPSVHVAVSSLVVTSQLLLSSASLAPAQGGRRRRLLALPPPPPPFAPPPPPAAPPPLAACLAAALGVAPASRVSIGPVITASAPFASSPPSPPPGLPSLLVPVTVVGFSPDAAGAAAATAVLVALRSVASAASQAHNATAATSSSSSDAALADAAASAENISSSLAACGYTLDSTGSLPAPRPTLAASFSITIRPAAAASSTGDAAAVRSKLFASGSSSSLSAALAVALQTFRVTASLGGAIITATAALPPPPILPPGAASPAAAVAGGSAPSSPPAAAAVTSAAAAAAAVGCCCCALGVAVRARSRRRARLPHLAFDADGSDHRCGAPSPAYTPDGSSSGGWRDRPSRDDGAPSRGASLFARGRSRAALVSSIVFGGAPIPLPGQTRAEQLLALGGPAELVPIEKVVVWGEAAVGRISTTSRRLSDALGDFASRMSFSRGVMEEGESSLEQHSCRFRRASTGGVSRRLSGRWDCTQRVWEWEARGGASDSGATAALSAADGRSPPRPRRTSCAEVRAERAAAAAAAACEADAAVAAGAAAEWALRFGTPSRHARAMLAALASRRSPPRVDDDAARRASVSLDSHLSPPSPWEAPNGNDLCASTPVGAVPLLMLPRRLSRGAERLTTNPLWGVE